MERTCAPGLGVPAVSEEVDKGVGNMGLLGGLQKGKEVVDVAVHAAIRNQTQQMQAPIPGLGPVKSPHQRRQLANRLVFNGLVNSDNILLKGA